MTRFRYLVASGSNRRHHRLGNPRAIIAAVPALLEAVGINVLATAPPINSLPLGPSQRLYANSAVVIDSDLTPDALLRQLKAIEASLGPRRGRRWSARRLDLDIILWSGGIFTTPKLSIPHPAFRDRDFVLRPAARLAGGWRDPVTGLTVRQLAFRHRHQSPTAR